MSVKEYGEEECALCSVYHCENYFCYDCLIRYAVEAGADKEKLHQRIEGILKRDYISDLKFRIKEVEESPNKQNVLNEMYQELRKLELG